MKPPKHIKVCGHRVDLEFKSLSENLGTFDVFETSKAHLTITVESALTGRMIADTVLHELLHAIYYLAPVQGKDKEERTVTSIATHLTMVFAENPKFRDWWNELL